jgi:hypothetical protein
MNPRLLSTPRLSVRERALLLTLLVFDNKRAEALLQRLSPRGDEIIAQLRELPKVELKLLVVELRRMLDQRFEGLSLVHPTWLLAPIEGESELLRSLWLAELPIPSNDALQRAPAHLLPLLRVLFTGRLVEMPPEPREKQWHRRHLADLPEPLLQKLLSFIQPQELGCAISDLGSELAQKLAQRLSRAQGEVLLQGYREQTTPNAIFLLMRAAEKSGIALEK